MNGYYELVSNPMKPSLIFLVSAIAGSACSALPIVDINDEAYRYHPPTQNQHDLLNARRAEQARLATQPTGHGGTAENSGTVPDPHSNQAVAHPSSQGAERKQQRTHTAQTPPVFGPVHQHPVAHQGAAATQQNTRQFTFPRNPVMTTPAGNLAREAELVTEWEHSERKRAAINKKKQTTRKPVPTPAELAREAELVPKHQPVHQNIGQPSRATHAGGGHIVSVTPNKVTSTSRLGTPVLPLGQTREAHRHGQPTIKVDDPHGVPLTPNKVTSTSRTLGQQYARSGLKVHTTSLHPHAGGASPISPVSPLGPVQESAEWAAARRYAAGRH